MEEEEEYTEVVCDQDEAGHWYIYPKELKSEFDRLIEGDYDEFQAMFDEYSTGGCLSLVKLYIKN